MVPLKCVQIENVERVRAAQLIFSAEDVHEIAVKLSDVASPSSWGTTACYAFFPNELPRKLTELVYGRAKQ